MEDDGRDIRERKNTQPKTRHMASIHTIYELFQEQRSNVQEDARIEVAGCITEQYSNGGLDFLLVIGGCNPIFITPWQIGLASATPMTRFNRLISVVIPILISREAPKTTWISALWDTVFEQGT